MKPRAVVIFEIAQHRQNAQKMILAAMLAAATIVGFAALLMSSLY